MAVKFITKSIDWTNYPNLQKESFFTELQLWYRRYHLKVPSYIRGLIKVGPPVSTEVDLELRLLLQNVAKELGA